MLKSALKRTLCLIILLFATFSLQACDFFKDEEVTYKDTVNIDMAVIWNGLSSIYPSTGSNNPTAEVIRQKTGVNVEFTFYDGFENDNLTRLFTVGKNMPEVIMAPYWGGGDACSAAIRQAVEDGFLIPVDEYLDTIAPNLKDSWTNGVSKSFQENELTHKAFNGKKYIIPMQTPAAHEDFSNWCYDVFCRKDILEALNVDPGSIHTSEDIYELAKKIKAGSFKDINGNDIIICSTFANGYSYECYLNSFKSRRAMTNVIQKDDGSLDWICNSPKLEEEIKFMNKMINEGLFDKSAFSHNQDTVTQKMINGSVAMTACRYAQVDMLLSNTLYKTNPEMEYVPLGPIYDANGEAAMPDSYRENSGEYGFPVILITRDCKNVEAFMRYLNYINSDEGERICILGVEGEDWEYNKKGEIVRTAKWEEEIAKNPNYDIERGTKYLYIGISQVHQHLYDTASSRNNPWYDRLKEMYPVYFSQGTFASSFDEEFEEIEYFRNILGAMNYQTTIESAYCAKDETKALAILSTYRKNLAKNGYLERYLAWLTERLKGIDDVLF